MGSSKLKKQKKAGRIEKQIDDAEALSPPPEVQKERLPFFRCNTAPCESTAVASYNRHTAEPEDAEDVGAEVHARALRRMFGRGSVFSMSAVTDTSNTVNDATQQVEIRRVIGASIQPKLTRLNFHAPTDPAERAQWFSMEDYRMDMSLARQLAEMDNKRKMNGIIPTSSSLAVSSLSRAQHQANGASSGGGSPSSNASSQAAGSSSARDRLAQRAKKKIQEENEEPVHGVDPTATSPEEATATSSTVLTSGSSGKYDKQQFRTQMIHFQLKSEQLEENLRQASARQEVELAAKDDSYRDQIMNLSTRMTEVRESCERETKKRMLAEEEVTKLKLGTDELKRSVELQKTTQADLQRRNAETLQRMQPMQRELEELRKNFGDAQVELDRCQARYQKAEEQVKRKEATMRQKEAEVTFYKEGSALDHNGHDVMKLKDAELGKKEFEIRSLQDELELKTVQLKNKTSELEKGEHRLRDQVSRWVAAAKKTKEDMLAKDNTLRENQTTIEHQKALIAGLNATITTGFTGEKKVGAHPSSSLIPVASTAASALQQMNALAEAQREIERLNADNANLRESLKKMMDNHKVATEETKRLREDNMVHMNTFAEGMQSHFLQSTALVLSHEQVNEGLMRRRIQEKEALSRGALLHFEHVQFAAVELDEDPFSRAAVAAPIPANALTTSPSPVKSSPPPAADGKLEQKAATTATMKKKGKK